MKNMSRFVSLFFVVLVLCSFLCASAAVAENGISILNPSAGELVDADESLKVKIRISGAKPSFQQIAFRDLTTNEKHIDNREFSGNSYKISRKMLKPGHSYRVWVAMFDHNGEKIAQDMVEFTAASFHLEYTCPFRHDYKTDSFADMYWHCLSTGCFKDNAFLRASWEGGWALLGTGLDNPLYSAIIDMIR